jgi:lysophospholipase L1-like esterase
MRYRLFVDRPRVAAPPQRICHLKSIPLKSILCSCIIALILPSGCSKSPNLVVVSPDSGPFDTSFAVNSLIMPDTEVLARSVASRGNLERLHFFLSKASAGQSLRIGCIGGSITGGALATTEEKQYPNRLGSFLKRLFPKSNFSIINAAIAATNSRFGCSRVHDDLLIGNPDLIIIEYAVNADRSDSIMNIRTMEGLVRQCLRLDSVPTLMLFTTDSFGDTIRIHQQGIVGVHYALPIISYRNAVWPLFANGQLPWASIEADGVHPNDNGHLMIAYLLYSFIKTVFLEMDSIPAFPFQMPSPLSTDLYEFAGIHSLKSDDPLVVETNSGWTPVEKEYKRLGYTSSNYGDSIVFTTTLNEVTIGYHYWKNLSGRLQVNLDGQIIDTLSNYFAEDWGPGYLALYHVYTQDDNKMRTLTLRNIDGALFDIQYILYAGFRDGSYTAAVTNNFAE